MRFSSNSFLESLFFTRKKKYTLENYINPDPNGTILLGRSEIYNNYFFSEKISYHSFMEIYYVHFLTTFCLKQSAGARKKLKMFTSCKIETSCQLNAHISFNWF